MGHCCDVFVVTAGGVPYVIVFRIGIGNHVLSKNRHRIENKED
jgi:hypothetical protein